MKAEHFLKLRRSFLDGIATLEKFWAASNPGMALPVDPLDFTSNETRQLQCPGCMNFFTSKNGSKLCANCEINRTAP